MRSSNISYLPQIDHLRAIAAIWIIFYHGEQLFGAILRTGKSFTGEWHFTMQPLVAVIREGHTAVALFMVLSGFIFTYGAYSKSVNYGRFLINRLLRIYPLYLSVIFLSIASQPSGFTVGTFVTTILPLANIQVLDTGPLSAMAWAVAVELQFYLLYPFLLRFLNENAWKYIIAVLSCALLFRLMSIGLGASPRDLSYWHIFGRIDQFALGMIAAVICKRRSVNRIAMAITLGISIVIIVSILFGFHRLGGWPSDQPWKIVWPTIEGLCYALLIIAYVGSGDFLPKRFSRKLAYVGEISFSIYLLHFAMIDIVIKQDWLWRASGNPTIDGVLSTITIAIPLTIAVSIITYRSIELPFLHMRRRYIQETNA